MHGQKHFYPMTVLESHLDLFGHMNHAVYLSILEEARWDLVTQRGYGLKEMTEIQQGPVILEANLRFKRELRLRLKIVIETQLVSYNKKLAEFHQEIKDEEGSVYFTADFKFGLFDMKSRKLILPTPAWLHAIGVKDPQETE